VVPLRPVRRTWEAHRNDLVEAVAEPRPQLPGREGATTVGGCAAGALGGGSTTTAGGGGATAAGGSGAGGAICASDALLMLISANAEQSSDAGRRGDLAMMRPSMFGGSLVILAPFRFSFQKSIRGMQNIARRRVRRLHCQGSLGGSEGRPCFDC
jgi:hypothetical protein